MVSTSVSYCKMEVTNNKIQWTRKSDIKISPGMLMSGESWLRNRIVRVLSGWDGASTCVFGGSIRRTILSEHTIDNNEELQSRLADDSYHDLDLSSDHFLPLGTDLDVYISHPKNVQTCIDDLRTYLQRAMVGCTILSYRASYACTRVLVKTLPHGIGPHIQIKLDLVMDGERSLFPDFSCNQLCVSTSTLALSVFSPLGMDKWWESNQILEECVGTPFGGYSSSILGGKHDKMRRALECIERQIVHKVGNVLLFSYRRWTQERLRMRRRRDNKSYSAYVETIVNMLLLKLLKDGFTVNGFHPTITSDYEFCCQQSGYKTPISLVQICSSYIPPVVMPGAITGHWKGRGQGKGCGRGHGRFCSDCDSDTESDNKYEYKTEEEYKDEYKDQDKDEDAEQDDDIRPYYWCIGCSEWHEIVTFLLP
jgi:hypothetical protein